MTQDTNVYRVPSGPGDTYSGGFDISRVAGFEANSLTRYAVTQSGSGLVLTPVPVVYPQDIDVSKTASLTLNYPITRAWGASCSVAYERRDVTVLVSYSYTANTYGCATPFTWR